MGLTVLELIGRLTTLPLDAKVIMCMDWTELPDEEKPAHYAGQWEDALGEVTCAASTNSKWVYLLNENFK